MIIPAYLALRTAIACAIVLAMPFASAAEAPPVHRLVNEHAEIIVLLPDDQASFYRGPRFDHSGIVGFAEARGHTFIGKRSAAGERKYSLGTSMEFLEPIPTGNGGGSVKIGVGLIEGAGVEARLIQRGTWVLATGTNSIAFSQEFATGDASYRYTKKITLADEAAAFTVSCELANSGRRAIRTVAYWHNWFRIDDTGVGPAYRLTFPYQLEPTKLKAKHGGFIVGSAIEFKTPHDTPPSHAFYAEFPWQSRVAMNRMSLTNTGSGASINLTGDWTPFKHHIFATSEEMCPEPFIELHLEPGERRSWALRYELLTFPVKPKFDAEIPTSR